MRKSVEVSKDEALKVEADSILSLMREGWSLGRSAITHRYWLQLGELGKGGPSKAASEKAVNYLLERNFISKLSTEDGHRSEYRLV